MFKKVIWATDGFDHADRAMTTAVQVAQNDGAELHVVHIVEKLISRRAAGMNVFANEDEIEEKVERQAKTIADESGVKTSIYVVAGLGNRIGDRIADIADDAGADLIVVGTRGHGALGSLALGSVTQRLLQVAHCPVLAVPPTAAAVTDATPESALNAG
ncbi:MAG: universal stress protein [Solirubrobacteraceae bacterium]